MFILGLDSLHIFEDTVWVVVHTLCELARMSIHTALRAYEFLNQNLLP